MNLRDVESAFMDMRAVSASSVKWVYVPTLRSYVKLLKNQGKHEMAAKFKEYFEHKIWDTCQVLYSPADIKSEIKTMCHGDFWVNNMMFNSSDPKVIILGHSVYNNTEHFSRSQVENLSIKGQKSISYHIESSI